MRSGSGAGTWEPEQYVILWSINKADKLIVHFTRNVTETNKQQVYSQDG